MKASERISGIGCELRAIQSSDLARDPAQIAAVVVESLAILAELLEGGQVKEAPSLRSALQVIHTWATVQLERPGQTVLDAQNVLDLCEKAMKEGK